MNQRRLFPCSSFSLLSDAERCVSSLVSTLSPTSILMPEVSCQSARRGLSRFIILRLYSLSFPCLSQSPASSRTSQPTPGLCRFLALHKIKCQRGVSICRDRSFTSCLLLSRLLLFHTFFATVVGRL